MCGRGNEINDDFKYPKATINANYQYFTKYSSEEWEKIVKRIFVAVLLSAVILGGISLAYNM